MVRWGRCLTPPAGKIRTAYAFVATLCYSRHQYAELVFDQKVTTWISLHRRAFEYFGGVPRRVVPDNLKAAVIKVLVHDAVLGEAYRQMALYYGFLISPTRPYTPRHKGKVENGVHYVQRNFMAGQAFADIDCANQHLKIWIREVAGVRDHGTTHEAPLKLFNEFEQAALLKLPAEPFSLCEIRTAKVHPDCHVVVSGSFYSAPYIYVGQKLDVYVRERVVELYQGQKLVTTHVQLPKARPMANPSGALSGTQSRLFTAHARLLPPDRGSVGSGCQPGGGNTACLTGLWTACARYRPS